MKIGLVHGRFQPFHNGHKLLVGANIDLDSPYAEGAQWDVVFSSCVLSLTGYLPTHVYAGDNYSVRWERVKPEFRKFKRYDEISATDIRKLLNEKNFDELKKLVPEQIFEMVKAKQK